MKSIVKKIGISALCVWLCLVSVLTIAAAGNNVAIPECDGMTLTLPDNMTAVTRSTDKSDPYFMRDGNDYNTVMRDFEQNNIYMRASDNIAIILTLTSNTTPQSKEMENYNKYSFAQLEEIKNNTLNASDGTALYISGTPDEAGKDVVWIYYDITVDGRTQYRAETIYRGKIVTMTLFRNAGNVEVQDYQILSSVVSSIKFAPKSENADQKQMLIYIAIGAGAVALILLILLIVVIRTIKRRKPKEDNDRVLRELADKYHSNAPMKPYSEEEGAFEEEPAPTAAQQPEPSEAPAQPEQPVVSEAVALPEEYSDDEVYEGRKYSDADIARLLGDVEDDENFIEALPLMDADSEDDSEVRDSVTDPADNISEFFEDAPEDGAQDDAESVPQEPTDRSQEEAEEAAEAAEEAVAGETAANEAEDDSAEQLPEEPEQTEPSAEEEAQETSKAEPVAEEPVE